MKNHVLMCITKGWEHRKELIRFNTDLYSKEEALAQFIPIKEEIMKNNHWFPYTFYKFNDEVYYKVFYLGEYDGNNIPEISYIA